jgi:uncharacterized protein
MDMLYRPLGKTGRAISILGFGCMRLPIIAPTGKSTDAFDPAKAIDEEAAATMMRHAFEQGVNYFDTAYPYHGGQSEIVLGRGVKAFRDKIMLATKSPTWLVQSAGDFDRLLDEQLGKLQTDHLDVYLLHALNKGIWPRLKQCDFAGFLDRIKADGRARHVGFSFHDDAATFEEIVDAYDWDVCQIQYNYYDVEFQAGTRGLRYAAGKGLGVIIMEPLRGGRLTGRIPPAVRALWDSAPVKRTPAEWALRWVWNHPEVSTALSGMSAMEQVAENLRIAGTGLPGSLSPEELALVDRVRDTYRAILKVPCTGCAYCMPCPNGVNIPQNFTLYNEAFMFGDPDMAAFVYNRFLPPPSRASACLACGACEPHCPQGIPIMEELGKARTLLSRPGAQ